MTKQPTLTRDLSREEKIGKIYEVIKPTYFGDNTYQDMEYVMLGNILWYIAQKNREHTFTIRGNGVICFGERQGEVDFLEPIEAQENSFIDYIYSLI